MPASNVTVTLESIVREYFLKIISPSITFTTEKYYYEPGEVIQLY
jgi:hypothetical protein